MLTRALCDIANDIRKDWRKMYFGAVPYYDAMTQLDGINDHYGADSARSIVRYFLANASTWRGPVAKAIKTELNSMVKGS